MLKLTARNAQEVAQRAHERADRAEDISGAADVVLEALGNHATDVGEETGRLQDSLVPGSRENIFSISSNGKIVFGSKVPYARFYFGNTGEQPVGKAGVQAAATALAEWIAHG